ncbi:small membrane hydrophobic protein [Streptomyces albus subsp. albus]|nr:small membrane hydrophobic protein [Streptomyces albus subsp. albus]
MSLKTVNTALTTAFVLFTLWFGAEFILIPETVAPTFGLPSWPSGDGGGFLILKGIRDIAGGLVLGALLLTGQRRALGWVLLVEALIPFGDMTNVLAHDGSAAAAFGVHGLTAVAMVITGLLTLRETRKVTAAPASVPVPAVC